MANAFASVHFDACSTTHSPKEVQNYKSKTFRKWKSTWLDNQNTGPKPTAVTHRGGGGDLLGHDLQGVDHGDVAQTLSDGQGGVAVLRRAREKRALRASQ